jgi:hypothetical protein
VVKPVFGDVTIDHGVTRDMWEAEYKQETQSKRRGCCQQKEEPVPPDHLDNCFHG